MKNDATKKIIVHVISACACAVIWHLACAIDNSYGHRQRSLMAAAIVFLFMCAILTVIVLNVILYLSNDKGTINYGNQQGAQSNYPSWMDYMNFNNLNSVKREVEQINRRNSTKGE